MQEKQEKDTRLRHALFMLPVATYDDICREICSRCKVNRTVLNNWSSGRTKVLPLAKREIEQVLNQKIWDDEEESTKN